MPETVRGKMRERFGRNLRFHGTVLRESVATYFSRNTMTQAAAMAYYMVFSLPPILFIVIWTAARFYRESEMHEALTAELGELVGTDGAGQLMATIEGLNIAEPSAGATILGIGVMLFTATTILVTARKALNRIADVKPDMTKEHGILGMLLSRFVSSAMLVTFAIILLISQVVEAMVTALGRYVTSWAPEFGEFMMSFDSLLLDVGATALVVALFFRFLPDVRLPWKDIWLGAVVTAVLFTLGRSVIGYVIGQSRTANLYAAAGSLLVMMLWVYYASALFLFGATLAFTRARLLKTKPSISQGST